MVFPFLNPPPAIGCGDPGDPIDFGVLFTGSASLSGLVEAANTKQAVFDYKFKDCSAGGMSRLHISTTLGNNGNYFYVGQEADDLYSIYHGTIASTLFYVKSVGKLRDKAAHYEPHVRIDTTQAVASDRIQLWLGGVRMILTGTFPAQNADMFLLGGSQYHYIGSWFGSPNTPGGGGDVILSRVIYEHSVTPQLSDFGYFNAYGQWMNKTYSGPAVYHLAFKNGLDLGADETGVHDFTPNGLTFDSQVPDTPSHSFNTNDPNNTQSTVTLSNGNLTGTYSGTANVGASVGTMPIRSGRFYWEVKIDNLGGHENDIGVIPWRSVMIAGNPYSYTSGIVGSGEVVYCKDGGISRNGTYTAGYGASFATGDVIGVLVDCEQDTINFSKNGVWQGEIALCAKPFLTTNTNYSGSVMTSNFGQRAFVHPIPAGAKTLNTANLPCPEILNPDDYFTIRLVGDNTPLPWDALTGKTLAVTKDRNATTSFRVNDTLRGNGKAWACNEGGAEINEGAAGVTWTANGPVYGSAAEYQGNRITWFWRASPKAGFDLIEADHVTGTPTTVTHQAGGLIDYAWLVPLDGGDVRVFHRALPSGQYLRLNGGSVAGTDANWFTSTAINLTIGASLPSGRYLVAAWRTVSQFSAFVAYPGNSLVDGALCPLDFLPRFAFIKTSQAPNPHYALDIDRAPGNPITNELQPGTNGVEDTITIDAVDFVSNGLKQRSSTSENNTTPNTIIPVAAWAQTPGKFARAR